MKKNLFLGLCLMMAVVLSTFSCRQDLLPEQETYHNTSAFQLTSKRISLTEAKHKANLLPELEKAEAKFKEKSSAFGKIVDYGDGVSINTDDVIYIENGTGFHTYTFNIKYDNVPENAPVENLVLSSLPDGTYKKLLVSYNLTQQEKQDILAGKSINTNGKATVTEPTKGTYSGMLSKNSCNYETVDMVFSCYTGDHHAGNESTWGGCNWESTEGGYPPLHITMVALVCGADTSLGEEGTPGGGVSIGETGGLGSGNPEEIPTQPNLPIKSAPCQNVKNQFAKEAYKNKVATINKNYNFNLKYETGFKENKDGSFVDLAPSGKNALTIPFSVNTKGYTHVHNNDRGTGKYTPGGFEKIEAKVRMFSPADVDVLMGMADFNKSPENFADLYGTMLSSDGTFVIKFTGTAADIKTGFDTAVWRKKYEDYFTVEDGNNETKFLLFVKNEMQVKGISLYKVKSDGKVYEYKLNTAQTKAEPFECGN